ncbi:MAG TPA: tetraacyldisaccharide 4'-kinase [Pyrinomonadaceae bacterium]|nr:tetraacyldisaccharide 4'-kinase [Pyrinomonadaceae bacterium]
MASLSQLALAPLGVAYGAGVRARLALYRAGALTVHRAGAPVLSVGNITAGGTGKTPLVEWLARAAAEGGGRVCVLTRGYGREGGGRVVVSDGAKINADAREGGDEPRLLAERLLKHGVAVVADADRVDAARWARENLRSEVFVLDDGFQHLRLARDLNVVTLDASDPWGGGRLLPAGRLREPRGGLGRADCVVITRAELAGDLTALRAEAAEASGGRPVFVAGTATIGVRTLAAGESEIAADQNSVARPVAAFCGIGNPRAFYAHLRREGFVVAHERAFRDHHFYSQAEIDALCREAVGRGARALVTTAKDAVKLGALRFALPCYVIEIGLGFEDEEGFLELVRAAIRRA